ncbi:MarR family winged helix-turn-helix transcriptional regulator [Intestinibacter sp.]|uniref:MarR family winged helix-turn-helix transcriptional regulator n=1 Tax=Intestinibacter sp. TaxID=1965304 RepID=UPI002A908A63|nr:MarR family transcriptional regulator [Intestinibacter sp.]MDY5213093.1 MarR family transcriptional regulator [Intestinibacter sp.]
MEEKIMLGFLFKQIHIAFEARCNKNLQNYNLTQSQMDVLLYLKKHEDSIVTQRDLEAGLRLKNPTVTGILNRLEEKNLIIREQNLNDKRSKIIKMTQKSRAVLKDAYLYIQQLEAQMLTGISEDERKQLSKFLCKILNNFK